MRRVLVLGATGTIGRATVRALLARGHDVVCFARDVRSDARRGIPEGAELRAGDVTDPASVARDGFRGEHFDTVVSCMASRSGRPDDAWAIDHRAHLNVLEVAASLGVDHFVLLSAICVQKPRLEFQRAKLAFEAALIESDVAWSIVRPTAFFKSLAGQLARVRAGRPFLFFGDGTVTACKPIGDEDLSDFLVRVVDDPALRGRILPIGGPGPALTARDHGRLLFEETGMPPRFRSVPVALLDVIVGGLSLAARLVPALEAKAELARIGRYYATESMLVWDPVAGRYDADATPEHGTVTLADYYRQLVRGEAADERGEHAIF